MAKEMITREQRKRKPKVNVEDYPIEIIYNGVDGTSIFVKKLVKMYYKWLEEEYENEIKAL